MSKLGEQPAFPQGDLVGPHIDPSVVNIRLWLAAQAMQGMLASRSLMCYLADTGAKENQPGMILLTVPQMAVKMADAMLAEIEKGKE